MMYRIETLFISVGCLDVKRQQRTGSSTRKISTAKEWWGEWTRASEDGHYGVWMQRF